MIEIVVYRSGSELRRVTVEGHAGFSDEEDGGGDIVCAAVSALVGFLGITFSELLPHAGRASASDGEFDLAFDDEWSHSPELRLVLEGWVRSIRSLEDNYRGWVKLVERDLNLELT